MLSDVGILDAARAAWLAEAKGNAAETERRSASTFLGAVDESGLVADFHGLRHTFVSNLASAGVHPKVAQRLARHSTITLTMDRYSHLGLLDMTAGLSALPTIATSDANLQRATGTTDAIGNDSNLSCTKSCNGPVQLNRFQPLSTGSDDAPSTIEKPRISLRKTL